MTENVQQPLRYMARELDPITGRYYVRNRWHSPGVATDTVPLRSPGPIRDTEMTLFPEPEERTWLRLGGLRIMLREFRADHGRLPEKIEDFRPAAGTQWIDYELDAWGEPIVYRVCPNGYELRSAGIDRRLDTEDDLIPDGAGDCAFRPRCRVHRL